MHRCCEACNACLFHFLARFFKNLLVKAVFASYYLKLSLPVFLNFAQFQPHVFIERFLIKKEYFLSCFGWYSRLVDCTFMAIVDFGDKI